MAPFHHLRQSPTTFDLATCAALMQRGRVTDLFILCLGVGLGILIYALMHDLASRGRCNTCSCAGQQHANSSWSAETLPAYVVHASGPVDLNAAVVQRPVATKE
ncbi:uncharacterized protein EHS24_009290 [Apiotrichum porosum]|uniref:Uncharacterized protein n=1 Tax=Apiotrichum porosum TaxID=105984 RepID=A0A427XLD6_9TREE|nr:uncharacterized protein EHS24_009290 [Apiotrichum porosum]RSH79638.1 hypothetical protein EHS24_009290 [Apiotrichum porosum]